MTAHYLPTQSTPFIGRARELVQMADLICQPACRLLTLIGPGGIGKTRLALEAAQQQIPHFADGVYFVPLIPLNSSDAIVSAVAEVIGFSFFPGDEPLRQLLNYLHGRQLLLVLDNFEHLLTHVNLITHILQAAPGAKFLVTSRERLNLLEETLFRVEGMDYPDQDTAPDAAEYGAVQLLVDRAYHLRPEIPLTASTFADATLICRQVQGMPLAIVLAAGWIHSLSLQEIAQEIARGFDLLQTETRNMPERHRHIRAVFDPSWSMLSEAERMVFTKLSVFRGSFTREAAQSVAGASLSVLAALVNKSMIRHTPAGRYDIHELLRQYAEEKLNALSQECPTVHDQFSAYYAEFMERQGKRLDDEHQKIALNEVEIECDNVLAAWHYVLRQRKAVAIRKFIPGLHLFFDLRSRFQEIHDLLAQAVETLRADFLNDEIESLVGLLLAEQSWFSCGIGHPEKGKIIGYEALAIARRAANQEDELDALTGIVINLSFLGQRDEEKLVALEGLEISRKLGNLRKETDFLYWLGNINVVLGNPTEARRLGEEIMRIGVRSPWFRGHVLSFVLAGAARAFGDYAEARRLIQQSLAIQQEIGQPWGIAVTFGSLGDVALLAGEFAEARYAYLQRLQIFHEWGHQLFETIATLLMMAKLLAAQHQYEQAVELLALVRSHASSLEETRDAAHFLLTDLQDKLPASIYAAALKRGTASDLESVVEELLSEPGGTKSGPRTNAILPELLSERELEVLHLIADGLSNAEIAQKLYLSVGTVKVHTSHIYNKLAVSNRTEAVVQAQKLNLL